MGLAANMAPYIKDALAEIPVNFRDEVSDVLCAEYSFEEWRLAQEPVVDDTAANRANFISLQLAYNVVGKIRRLVNEARSATATASTDLDLGV